MSMVQRAAALFPGVSNGEYGFPPDLALVVERGEGSRIWDSEGRRYLDMTMAWGAALPGHAHPQVVEAATRQASDGANFAALNRRAVELAERIAAICPCVERIRFVASGTEATALCLRVARGATGKPKVLKFEGAYHGQHPVGVASMLRSARPGLPLADGKGAGAPWVEQSVLVAPYNDADATERLIADHAHELAAVIVEPLHRCLTPAEGFLQRLRACTARHGVILIFDEVVTGFRLALGGAQEYYGVTPDLVAYGKALGGGFPIGAFGGRAEVMECVSEQRIDDDQYVWSASTGGGNPVSCAAALAAIQLYSQTGAYERLHQMGAALRERMRAALDDAQIAGQVLGDGPLAQVAFSERPVVDQRSWLASDRARGRRLMLELMRLGVFLNPMGTKLYLSLAHDEATIDEFTKLFRRALESESGRPKPQAEQSPPQAKAHRGPWLQFGLITIFVVLTYAALFQFAFAHLLRRNPEGAFWAVALGAPHTLLIALLILMAWRYGATGRRKT